MMTLNRTVPTLVLLAGFSCCIGSAKAQTVHRVQPIVLTASPGCCSNPAAMASEPATLPVRDCTYLRPEDRDPMRLAATCSQLIPLPTPLEWRGYETRIQQVAGYGDPQVPLPVTESVQVLRPITAMPPEITVPPGYVVGKGLLGQPKLYKPGQPFRNFLRYITL